MTETEVITYVISPCDITISEAYGEPDDLT